MTQNNLQRLLYLCHVKNELNRKRRRWYHWAFQHIFIESDSKRYGRRSIFPSPYTKAYAEEQYEKSKLEMKALTAEIRQLRLSLKAQTRWNSGGLIVQVIVDGQTIDHKSFYKSFADEVFEMDVLK